MIARWCGERLAVIGDIHGDSEALARLLRLLDARPLAVVGDICDRGPDTRGVIELLIQHGAIGVRGNHDEWLCTWLAGGGFDDWALRSTMGGQQTLASYGVVGSRASEVERQAWRIPDEHRRWLASLVLALDLDVAGCRFWAVHAGVPRNALELGVAPHEVVPWLVRHRSRELLWGTTSAEEMPKLDRPVICGHTPRRDPVDLGHVIAVDTGAGTCADGRLTAVLLPERTFVTT